MSRSEKGAGGDAHAALREKRAGRGACGVQSIRPLAELRDAATIRPPLGCGRQQLSARWRVRRSITRPASLARSAHSVARTLELKIIKMASVCASVVRNRVGISVPNMAAGCCVWRVWQAQRTQFWVLGDIPVGAGSDLRIRSTDLARR